MKIKKKVEAYFDLYDMKSVNLLEKKAVIVDRCYLRAPYISA